MVKAPGKSRTEIDDPFSRVVEILSNLIIPAKYEAAHLKSQSDAVSLIIKMIDGGEFTQRSTGESKFSVSQLLDFQVPLNANSAREKFVAYWSSNNALDLLTSVLCVNSDDAQACSAVIRIITALSVDSVRLWASLSFNKFRPLSSLINFTCRTCPEELTPTAFNLLASVCSQSGSVSKIAELFAKNNASLQFLIKKACEDSSAQIHATKLLM